MSEKKKNSIDLKNLIKKHFSFLIEDYGFKEVSSESDTLGFRILLCNSTTGVRIIYEPREGGIFLTIIRLIYNKIPAYPVFINEDTPVNYFDFQDLLSIRDPNFKEESYERIESTREIEGYIEKMAKKLNDNASDVLNGDFKIFSELDKIVKNRARSFRQ